MEHNGMIWRQMMNYTTPKYLIIIKITYKVNVYTSCDVENLKCKMNLRFFLVTFYKKGNK